MPAPWGREKLCLKREEKNFIIDATAPLFKQTDVSFQTTYHWGMEEVIILQQKNWQKMKKKITALIIAVQKMWELQYKLLFH